MNGLSAEDRARLEGLLDYLQRTEDHPQAKADVDVFARALALIDQQEEALRAADDLYDEALFHAVPESQLAVFTRAYRSARATSTKEDG